MAFEQNFDNGSGISYDYTPFGGWASVTYNNYTIPAYNRASYQPATAVTGAHVLTGTNDLGSTEFLTFYGLTHSGGGADTPSEVLTGGKQNWLRFYLKVPPVEQFDHVLLIEWGLSGWVEFFENTYIDHGIFINNQGQISSFRGPRSMETAPVFTTIPEGSIGYNQIIRLEIMRSATNCEVRVFQGANLQASHASGNYLSLTSANGYMGSYGFGGGTPNRSIGASSINWDYWPNILHKALPLPLYSWIDAVSFSTTGWIGPENSSNYPTGPVSSGKSYSGIVPI